MYIYWHGVASTSSIKRLDRQTSIGISWHKLRSTQKISITTTFVSLDIWVFVNKNLKFPSLKIQFDVDRCCQ
jgi:hypothetical protein